MISCNYHFNASTFQLFFSHGSPLVLEDCCLFFFVKLQCCSQQQCLFDLETMEFLIAFQSNLSPKNSQKKNVESQFFFNHPTL